LDPLDRERERERGVKIGREEEEAFFDPFDSIHFCLSLSCTHKHTHTHTVSLFHTLFFSLSFHQLPYLLTQTLTNYFPLSQTSSLFLSNSLKLSLSFTYMSLFFFFLSSSRWHSLAPSISPFSLTHTLSPYSVFLALTHYLSFAEATQRMRSKWKKKICLCCTPWQNKIILVYHFTAFLFREIAIPLTFLYLSPEGSQIVIVKVYSCGEMFTQRLYTNILDLRKTNAYSTEDFQEMKRKSQYLFQTLTITLWVILEHPTFSLHFSKDQKLTRISLSRYDDQYVSIWKPLSCGFHAWGPTLHIYSIQKALRPAKHANIFFSILALLRPAADRGWVVVNFWPEPWIQFRARVIGFKSWPTKINSRYFSTSLRKRVRERERKKERMREKDRDTVRTRRRRSRKRQR